MKQRKLRWLTEWPIAHRGLHDILRGRPENTLAAFQAAIERNYAIECDLHISSDGIPVVFHDDDLMRLAGAEGAVRDRTAAELGTLRLAGSGEWIPTLDELLELTAGRVTLVLELKHVPGRDAGLAAGVAARLKGYEGPVALMSFDHALIADAKAEAPHLPTGLVAAGDWRTGKHHLSAVRRLEADFVSYHLGDLPMWMPWLTRRAFGLPLICWTVRTPQQLEKAQALDRPDHLRGHSSLEAHGLLPRRRRGRRSYSCSRINGRCRRSAASPGR